MVSTETENEVKRDKVKRDNSVKAASLVVIVAILSFVFLKTDADDTCKLAASGVGLIATGISKGKSATALAGIAIGGAFIPDACESVIASFIETPNVPQTIEVETPGGTSTVTSTGSELLDPNPQPDSAHNIRVFECVAAYPSSEVLRAWCYEGRIDPPPA